MRGIQIVMVLKIPEKLLGVMTVLGSLLLNVLSGNIMNWGALLPYVTSYLSSTNSTVSSSLVYDTQPFSMVAEVLGAMIAPTLSKKLGVRLYLLLGGLLISVAYLLSSVISTPCLFVLVYSGFLGIGTGIICVSLVGSTSLSPKAKSLASSCLGTEVLV